MDFRPQIPFCLPFHFFLSSFGTDTYKGLKVLVSIQESLNHVLPFVEKTFPESWAALVSW